MELWGPDSKHVGDLVALAGSEPFKALTFNRRVGRGQIREVIHYNTWNPGRQYKEKHTVSCEVYSSVVERR